MKRKDIIIKIKGDIDFCKEMKERNKDKLTISYLEGKISGYQFALILLEDY